MMYKRKALTYILANLLLFVVKAQVVSSVPKAAFELNEMVAFLHEDSKDFIWTSVFESVSSNGVGLQNPTPFTYKAYL